MTNEKASQHEVRVAIRLLEALSEGELTQLQAMLVDDALAHLRHGEVLLKDSP